MYSREMPRRWEELYTAALLELDKQKLHPRILAAKMAVCDRAEELNGNGTLSERVALNHAIKALCELESLYFSNRVD
jgi:hypothetical protein